MARLRVMARGRCPFAVLVLFVALFVPGVLAQTAPAAAKRPMTFLDVQKMRQAGSPAPSPDGKLLLYTVSTPDWKEAKAQTDVYLVSIEKGVPSTRQMTFTKDKNETEPRWLKDSASFIFASNREAPSSAATQNQLYLMRVDGGEARKITDAKEGVTTFALSKDGKWLVYRSGKAGEEQLYRLPVDGIDLAVPEALTKQAAGVGAWKWAPDGKRIYFTGPETPDPDEKARREKKFTVDIRNAETPLASLWAVDIQPRKVTQLTKDSTIAVADVTISADSKWVGFRGVSADRYKRNITEQNINSDPFLLNATTGEVERLTNNVEVGESAPTFSPDSRLVAVSAPDELEKYTMKNQRLYLRPVAEKGGKWRKLGAGYDGDVTADFWSKDGHTIYFNDGIRATTQLFALDVPKEAVRQLTNEKAALTVTQDEDTGVILIDYSDGATPPTTFTAPSMQALATRASWIALTDANPAGAGLRARRAGGVHLEVEGRQDGRRRPRQAGRLPARRALPADRRNPRRPRCR